MSYDYDLSYVQRSTERSPGKYAQKLATLKQMIREYVHENAALVDELEEVQVNTVVREEERKFLLRKLCEYEPQVMLEVQNAAKESMPARSNVNAVGNATSDVKKGKKRSCYDGKDKQQCPTMAKVRKNSSRSRKKLVQPIPVDHTGQPMLPLELGRLTLHYLGQIICETPEFHTETVIYPVGYISTRIYGSLHNPTAKCIYTCKISMADNLPRFEISYDDNSPPIIGDTPDMCHSSLLQRINDALSFNVVSTRPRGNEFFGLSHPTVLYLLQNCPRARNCTKYKWCKFEVLKNGETNVDDNDAALSYEYLQRSINFCKYKMAPDILQKPDEYMDTL